MKRLATNDQRRVATKDWDHTGATRQGLKIICPDCGVTGYPDGPWIDRHITKPHLTAPCGRKTTALATHLAQCRDCPRVRRAA